MSDLKTIVAAVDGSEASASVLEVAGTLAARVEGSTRFAVHAVPSLPAALEEVLFPWVCLGDEREAVVRELVDAARRMVGEGVRRAWSGVSLREELHVACGPPAEVILAQSDRLGPDVLVLGASGEQERPGMLGSVATAALARARTPVLVTRRAGGRAIGRMIVALDLSPQCRPLLEQVLVWAVALESEVVPVAVVPTTAALDHAEITDGRDPGGKVRKQAERNMQQVLGSLDLPFAVAERAAALLQAPVLAVGDPGEELVRIAEELQADVVCVGRRRDAETGTGIGRVSEYVLRRAPRHVFVFPPAPRPAA